MLTKSVPCTPTVASETYGSAPMSLAAVPDMRQGEFEVRRRFEGLTKSGFAERLLPPAEMYDE